MRNINWPPVKAWTSNCLINGQRHFVAINYGGKLTGRWVVLNSVIDGSLVIKVPWSQLVNKTQWNSGWYDYSSSDLFVTVTNESLINTSPCSHLSSDSGLTIPITKKNIRPWF